MATRRPAEDLLWQPSAAAEIRRYALSAAIVLSLGAGAFVWIDSQTDSPPRGSETEDAVLVDLPPALAASGTVPEAAEGPQQPAVDASPPVDAPKEVQAKMEQPAPVDQAAEQPTVPSLSRPEPAALSAPAQVATAPPGSPQPDKTAEPIDEAASRRRAVEAMSGWQRAMVGRLEAAKRGLHANGAYGTIDVAFSIDRSGRLLSIHVARSSGSARLDQAALALVRHAVPFPAPPRDLADAALSFTIPIVFASRP